MTTVGFFCEQLRLIMREGRMVKMGTTANKWICTFSFGNRSHFAYSCLQILAGLWSHVYFVCVHACTFKTSILQFSTNFLEVLKKHVWYFVTILFFFQILQHFSEKQGQYLLSCQFFVCFTTPLLLQAPK